MEGSHIAMHAFCALEEVRFIAERIEKGLAISFKG